MWPLDPGKLWFQWADRQAESHVAEIQIKSQKGKIAQHKHISACVCVHVRVHVCACVCDLAEEAGNPGPQKGPLPLLLTIPCLLLPKPLTLSPLSEVSGQHLSPPPSHLPNWISCGQRPLNECTSQP